MPILGFDVPVKDVDALFDRFDDNSSGDIDYRDLKKMLTPAVGTAASKPPKKKR